ncbi:hypothetical protein GCM10023085_24160 [Actinomadura viridis]|uniref:Uncharacterized protein n=1 Tax=Actinomadura viridis TaxID=58110 RepID=A0A931GJ02_9ACTN|nr:hypothetical protein [Actinomadura viridis]MBG6088790.1 hypothetical protein [Actinomadura viridis]
MPDMPSETNARPRPWIPAGGVRAALVGGNTVGAAVRESRPRADGYRHIDTPALIAKLRELHVNTYLFGVWDSPTDWADLCEEFLPAAAEAGIDVWPYLVPPSETDENGRASRPYLTDYLAWARAVAEASVRYPNLTAWAIDDFEFEVNARLFTPEYMTRMREIQREINPDLGFYTCVYYEVALDDAFLDKYTPFIDGVIYPFLDGPNKNTLDAGSVRRSLEAIRAKTEPRGLDLVLLVYAGRFLAATLGPTESYVRQAVDAGLRCTADGLISGVIAYGTQLDDAPTIASDNKAMYGNGRLSLSLPSETQRIPAGTWAQAGQVIHPDPASPRYELSFWHFDEFAPSTPGPGEVVKELLVDGEVVWTCDIHDEPWPLWIQGRSLQGPVDLTPWLTGKERATLTIRLRVVDETTGNRVDVGFDHLESIGFTLADPGFEEPAGWELTDSGGAAKAHIDIFVPDRPRRIRLAVADCFARSAETDGL